MMDAISEVITGLRIKREWKRKLPELPFVFNSCQILVYSQLVKTCFTEAFSDGTSKYE